jgi:hypothetical protein
MIDNDYDYGDYGECGIIQLCSCVVTNDARFTREINPWFSRQKRHSTRRSLCTGILNLKLREKLLKYYVWNKAECAADTWTLRNVDPKYLEVLICPGEGWRSFEPIV